MKFVTNNEIIRVALVLLIVVFSVSRSSGDNFDRILKDTAIRNGLVESSDLLIPTDAVLAKIGEGFFNSKNLANSRDIACLDCHLDEFSSADGLPLAIGVNGIGTGLERLQSNGEIIPRNTLPLWGRGHKKFDTFFWDGRVEVGESGFIRSQFGEAVPSSDALTVAVHLPLVEIKEMLVETKEVKENKLESTSAADNVFSYLLENLKKWEPELITRIAQAKGMDIDELSFIDIADSLAQFIRVNFAPSDTEFQKYVFNGMNLPAKAKEGALLFYGKGKCSVCHAGPYFTDFQYHTIPFPQLGSGKNGFGVDYGRFNVTHDPGDLYKFRTPPLLNVAQTGPYGHSGSVATLEKVIEFHFDPLRDINVLAQMGGLERTEYYKILSSSSASLMIPFLRENEVLELVAFLESLSF